MIRNLIKIIPLSLLAACGAPSPGDQTTPDPAEPREDVLFDDEVRLEAPGVRPAQFVSTDAEVTDAKWNPQALELDGLINNFDADESVYLAIRWDPAEAAALDIRQAAERDDAEPIGHEVGISRPDDAGRFSLRVDDRPPAEAFRSGPGARVAIGTLVAVQPRGVYYDACRDDVLGQVRGLRVAFADGHLGGYENSGMREQLRPGYHILEHVDSVSVDVALENNMVEGRPDRDVEACREAGGIACLRVWPKDRNVELDMFPRPALAWVEDRCELRR